MRHPGGPARRGAARRAGWGQDTWTARLLTETENLRAAAEWALASGHEALALRIAGASWRFCSTHGLGSEARGWLSRALAAESTQESPHRAMALIGAGNLYEDLRQNDTAQRYFAQALDVARASGDLAQEAQALVGLGTLAHDVGDYPRALALHTAAVAWALRAGIA